MKISRLPGITNEWALKKRQYRLRNSFEIFFLLNFLTDSPSMDVSHFFCVTSKNAIFSQWQRLKSRIS